MKRKKKDPLDSFLEGTLNQEGYTAFYCLEHGKQLVKLPNITIEVFGVEVQDLAPLCNVCSTSMVPEESFEEHHERRKRRLRRINMMYKNLEG